jgi:PAT family beta-lactamase induction signal transducer AmpG
MPLRRKLAWIALLYFAEGLPFGIVKEVVPVYFKVSGVSLTEIGLASLLGLPWTLKVIWSPLVDRFGERRVWVTGCLVVLALFTALVPLFEPGAPTFGLWTVLLAVTVASATQDVAIDAYTIGLVDRGEEGDANGVRVSAYRVALIASGGGLVFFAPVIGWPAVFAVAAALFAGLAVSTWGAPRIVVAVEERRRWLAPMRRWLLRPGAWAVFLFVLGYKLGDAALGPMIKPFWIDRGLTVGEIGVVSTSFGVLATIAGALVGGRFTSRWGILRALFVLGLVQALSNLGYAGVAWLDLPVRQGVVASFADALRAVGEPGRSLVYAASMVESFAGGLGSAAFLAFLMHICEKEHAAVQYAALSAVFALSRDVAGAISGWATTRLGYAPYFALTFLLAFPALALLPIVRTWIHDSD